MLYPLKFTPLFKERIWGGRLLATSMGKALPEGVKIGESWELSGVMGDVSVVSNGKLKGNSLEDLIEVYMGDLVGDKVYDKFGVEFPLLIKLIDAQQVLSIQVHPDDSLAKTRHHSYGKSEMWYVVACEPGASIFVGFNREVSQDEYLEAVEKGVLVSLLSEIKVAAGESFFIPAGTVHAIGKGVLIAEIQQTSDVTYRIDDWGRLDDKGEPRELHTDLALDAINFGVPAKIKKTPSPVANTAVLLERCPYFTTNIVRVEDCLVRDYIGLDSFVIYTCLEGSLSVRYSGGSVRLELGETLLIPAQEEHITLRGDGTFLEIFIDLD